MVELRRTTLLQIGDCLLRHELCRAERLPPYQWLDPDKRDLTRIDISIVNSPPLLQALSKATSGSPFLLQA